MPPGFAPAVDPDSPVPLYLQVESDLRRRIAVGELRPGMAVPPELELTRLYDVSRHTVRAALGRLQAEGVVERGAGRGTFVRAAGDRVRFYLDRSFTQQMAELGRAAHSRVLRAEPGVVSDADPRPLRARRGARCFRLTRLRFGDDEPIGVQHTTVLTERCPGVERHDFARESLYGVLAAAFALVVREIRHVVGASTADAEQAALLAIAPGDPLLVVHTTALLADQELLEYTTSHYRADRYEYGTRHVFE